MDDVYRKLSAVKLWKLKDAPKSNSLEVTEAWLNHDSETIRIDDRTVTQTELPEWLERTVQGAGKGTESLVLRLVWVTVFHDLDPDSETGHNNVSKPIRETLLKAFGLGLAYDYFRSFLAGITVLPEEQLPHGTREAYAFSYAPKLASIWSSTCRPPPCMTSTLTQGLVFLRAPAKPPHDAPQDTRPLEDILKLARKTLRSGWDAEILTNGAFPAYLFAMLLSGQIDQTQQNIKQMVRGIESRTGHHKFESRLEEAASGQWPVLSANASGMATKLASVERKSKTVEQLLEMILRTLARNERSLGFFTATEQAQTLGIGCDSIRSLRSQAEVLKHRHDMQAVDTQYILKRVEIQIQALFHIITQQDAFSNFKLSHHMAQTAEFSYRDAASMKTLAVVTMFFLPGSFVSALFSTALFAWDDVDRTSSKIEVPTTPQLKLYWAVTIPLTVMTFVLYFLWLWYQKEERKRNFKSDKEMNDDAAKTAELPMRGDGIAQADKKATFISKASNFS